jgi:hypothetical protein
MRRTLLAVGIAVLVSILFAPHETHWHWLGQFFYVQLTEQERGCETKVYLSTDPRAGIIGFDPSGRGAVRTDNVQEGFVCARLVSRLVLVPHILDRTSQSYSLGNFAGQTAFVAVLAAVIVNIRRPRT